MMKKDFSHINEQDNPHMVSVGYKPITNRLARAQAVVQVSKEVLANFTEGELSTKKGPVFQTAIIAGIQGAKKTGELIPLCHPIGMDHCDISIQVVDEEIVIECSVEVQAKTGIEMEALTGASISALTIYDMCKSFGHEIVIKHVRLMEKRGGKRTLREFDNRSVLK